MFLAMRLVFAEFVFCVGVDIGVYILAAMESPGEGRGEGCAQGE